MVAPHAPAGASGLWACSAPLRMRAPCCATLWASPRARWPGRVPRAGPRPELVGHAVPVVGLDPTEPGACPGVVLRVGAPPYLLETAPEMVPAPPPSSRVLFPGYTIQPLGDATPLAFLAGAGPAGLFATPDAFFPAEEAAMGDRPDDGEDDGPQGED